jgi:hypothetical protein
MSVIDLGRLLRSATTAFVVGCRVNQLDHPSFGGLVRVPLDNGTCIYGLIYDIHIDDDGLVRQLVTAEDVDENIIADNRLNRNIPLEMSVLTVGYSKGGKIYHLLPPVPPLSLDKIYLCDPQELCTFTQSGRFGYFRHILRGQEAPVSELLAAHLQQAAQAQRGAGSPDWVSAAVQELITLLRDDYPTLMSVLAAVGEATSEV